MDDSNLDQVELELSDELMKLQTEVVDKLLSLERKYEKNTVVTFIVSLAALLLEEDDVSAWMN